MQINQVNNINFSYIKTNAKATKSYSPQPKAISNIINYYPSIYYMNSLSFGKKKKKYLNPKEVIAKIGEENFPSSDYLEKLKAVNVLDYSSLYEFHLDYYKDLLDCNTLDEAKARYPEFSDVIDAKDIDLNFLNPHSTIWKVANGLIDGADINTFSLDLLKSFYGHLYSTRTDKQHYYNLSTDSIYTLFHTLNIKIFKKYNFYTTGTNPERLKRISECSKNAWANDDGTLLEKTRQRAFEVLQSQQVRANNIASMKTDEHKKILSAAQQKRWEEDDGTQRKQTSERSLKMWEQAGDKRREEQRQIAKDKLCTPEARAKNRAVAQTQEYREKLSKVGKESWAKDDGTRREISRMIASTILQTPQSLEAKNAALRTDEARQKNSELKKQFNIDHPEYKEAQKLAWQRHPEITNMMSEIALKYPVLGKIIGKVNRHEPLTDEEEKIHLAYFKECKSLMPDYLSIIGEEYRKILIELGIKQENKN